MGGEPTTHKIAHSEGEKIQGARRIIEMGLCFAGVVPAGDLHESMN
jgi:hypothetical protein